MKKDEIRQLKKQYLEYYRQLPIQKLAGDKIGKNEDTIILWKKQDNEFAIKVRQARADWALEQIKKVKSKEWLLERILNDHFGSKSKLEISNNKQPLIIRMIDYSKAVKKSKL